MDTIIDVRDLEIELEAITPHPGCNNDTNKHISKKLTVYQDIHSRTGKHSYTHLLFITNLFRATLTCPIEKYKAFVDQLKKRWIMEDITDEYYITKKIIKMAKNMTVNGEWKTDMTKNQKVVALTTKLVKMKNRLKNAEHRLNTGSKSIKNGTKKTTVEGIKTDDL